ncbi:MAG: alpha/beta hydrolase, partial [Candidatus Heimdallarchaeota archaeon]
MTSQEIMPGAKPFFYKKGKVGCLLCHGYTGTPDEVHNIGKYLACKGITTIAPLLPGHGTTIEDLLTKTANDWFAEYYYAFNWLEEHCEEFFVCGHSLGGALTLRFAIEHKVNGIITLATPTKLRFLHRTFLAIAGPIFKNAVHKKKKKEKQDQEKYTILCYDGYPIGPANSLRKLLKYNLTRLESISAPILILQGSLDDKWLKKKKKTIFESVSSKDK